MQQPFLWKRFKDDSIESYVGATNEPVLDLRPGKMNLRLMDGVTPGGHAVDSEIEAVINTPVITSPTNNAVDVSTTPIITANTFFGLTVDLTPDTHASSKWEVATDLAFTNVIFDSGEDTSNLTSIDLDSEGISLTRDTEYYVRVRYTATSGGVSEYSNPIHFTTDNFVGLVFTQDVFLSTYTAASTASSGNTPHIFLDNNTALVGLHNNTDASINGGRSTVALLTKINNVWSVSAYVPSPTNQTYFGKGIAFAKNVNRVIITDSTHIHVFSFSNNQLSLLTSISASLAQSINYISIDVSDDGGVLMVGLGGVDNNYGKLYIYRWNGTTYTLDASYRPASITTDTYYGAYASLSRDGTKVIANGVMNVNASYPTRYTGIDVLNISPGNITLDYNLTLLWSAGVSRDSLAVNQSRHRINADGSSVMLYNNSMMTKIDKVGGTWIKRESFTFRPGGHSVSYDFSDDGLYGGAGTVHGGDGLGKGVVMVSNGATPNASWSVLAETETLSYTVNYFGYGMRWNRAFTDLAALLKNPPGAPNGLYLRFYKLIK